jgi:hypothetical protein
MCEYSLHFLDSRPAKVGDKLVIAKSPHSITRYFCAVAEPSVAVCLQPGTELVFDDNVRYKRALSILPKIKLNGKTALFRQINLLPMFGGHRNGARMSNCCCKVPMPT